MNEIMNFIGAPSNTALFREVYLSLKDPLGLEEKALQLAED
jgi:hypothetical protein